MSKIQRELELLSRHNITVSVDTLFDSFNIKDIKEYILYLQYEVRKKDSDIKDLIVKNVTMEVELEKFNNK